MNGLKQIIVQLVSSLYRFNAILLCHCQCNIHGHYPQPGLSLISTHGYIQSMDISLYIHIHDNPDFIYLNAMSAWLSSLQQEMLYLNAGYQLVLLQAERPSSCLHGFHSLQVLMRMRLHGKERMHNLTRRNTSVTLKT